MKKLTILVVTLMMLLTVMGAMYVALADIMGNDKEDNLNNDGIIGNVSQAPDKPNAPSGPTSGKTNMAYTYITSATSSYEEQIFYWFDWGDGTNSGWVGPYLSGDSASVEHEWSEKGNYEIKVKAMSFHDAESEWYDPLSVKIPYGNGLFRSLFTRFLDRHPNVFPIIRRLFGQ